MYAVTYCLSHREACVQGGGRRTVRGARLPLRHTSHRRAPTAATLTLKYDRPTTRPHPPLRRRIDQALALHLGTAEERMAKRKAAKRELIHTGTDKRYLRRNAKGQLKESDDVGRSLAQDRKRAAKTKATKGRAIAATAEAFTAWCVSRSTKPRVRAIVEWSSGASGSTRPRKLAQCKRLTPATQWRARVQAFEIPDQQQPGVAPGGAPTDRPRNKLDRPRRRTAGRGFRHPSKLCSRKI